MDQSGIRCHGSSKEGGRWRVPWERVRHVETRLHGHRVTVTRARLDHRGPGDYKRASLAGDPNDFLSRHVIEHAARRAGVPVDAG